MSAGYFAARLRELREGAGLTQPDLAGRAGLSKAGIADLEQGRRQPGWETAVALADALGVSTEAFRQEPQGRPPAGRGRPRKVATPTPAVKGRRRARG